MLQIQVKISDFVSYCERVKAAGRNMASFLTVWGQAVAKEARTNARGKGGRHFWREIAQATRVQSVGPEEVSVANYHVAGGHKQTGGPIVAGKTSKYLTIPITDEARGKRAAEFEMGGRVLFVPKGTHVLGYSEDGAFHALFVLVTKTKPQKAEPWFPDAPRISEIGLYECSRFAQGAINA